MTRARTALLTATAIVGLLCTQPLSAALEITGTIPPGGTPVVIMPANPRIVPSTLLKFKLSSPSNGAQLTFCLGAPSNPCGLATSYVVNVAPGQAKFIIIDAQEFSRGSVLVVGQGTATTVGYSVAIE